ncbi:hypothetical protein CAEBREN_19761 [Caenorhabditis brenneri]|uniref:Sdz-33 F-box domain-containing protein n=1 Tax=Caenorhabditis brenneri TaxID=135651 RepID=G0N3N2_CAEBE|nr:hypothetical protein CAEBREN_19761 [Caenorhabditis brenneri]
MVENQVTPAYAYFSKKPPSELLRLLERVIDLFKNSTIHLDFDSRFWTRHDFISSFNWFIENPSEVPYVSMTCSHAEGVQFFLENYKKPSKKLRLVLDYENDEELELPDNLETTLFEEVEIHNSNSVNFNFYNIFSCSTLDCYEAQLTNQDLNTFIKNWQLGLTNSHWRSVYIEMSELIKLQDVLNGISATYRDPRTVKRQVSTAKESCWIFGGIDIQKHDGSATATIQWMDHKVENEDSEVPNKLIEEYERNNGIILDEENELRLLRYPQAEFFMYIW